MRSHLENNSSTWAVGAAVHRLLQPGDRNRARDPALRFRHMTVDVRSDELGSFAEQLVTRAQTAVMGLSN